MKFELQYCIPTEFLTEETFNLLIDKLVLEGYNLPQVYMSDLDNWQAFSWLGVNSYGDVLLYTESPWFYGSPVGGVGLYPKIYSKQWLNDYLGGT